MEHRCKSHIFCNLATPPLTHTGSQVKAVFLQSIWTWLWFREYLSRNRTALLLEPRNIFIFLERPCNFKCFGVLRNRLLWCYYRTGSARPSSIILRCPKSHDEANHVLTKNLSTFLKANSRIKIIGNSQPQPEVCLLVAQEVLSCIDFHKIKR